MLVCHIYHTANNAVREDTKFLLDIFELAAFKYALVLLLLLVNLSSLSSIYQESKPAVPIRVYMSTQIVKLSANAFVRKVSLALCHTCG